MTNPLDDVPVESVFEAPATGTPETADSPEITLYSRDDIESAVAAERSKWEASLAESLAAKDGELSAIKGKYDTATIEQSLATAAKAGDAVVDAQVVALLKGHTRIVDGQATVEIEGFQLSPSEAISWMRGQPERYGNLFKSNVISGLGLSSTAGGARGGKPLNLKNLSPREYRALKKENPAAIYGGGQ